MSETLRALIRECIHAELLADLSETRRIVRPPGTDVKRKSQEEIERERRVAQELEARSMGYVDDKSLSGDARASLDASRSRTTYRDFSGDRPLERPERLRAVAGTQVRPGHGSDLSTYAGHEKPLRRNPSDSDIRGSYHGQSMGRVAVKGVGTGEYMYPKGPDGKTRPFEKRRNMDSARFVWVEDGWNDEKKEYGAWVPNSEYSTNTYSKGPPKK